MDEFENPFSPGAGTPPPAFVGRDGLIKRYLVALRRTKSGRPGKSIMPIGLRGVGKTVLLNRFHEMAQEQELVAAFIEAPETGDFKSILAARLRTILLELDKGPVSRAVKQALGALKSFTYTLPDSSSISLNVDAIEGTTGRQRSNTELLHVAIAIFDFPEIGSTRQQYDAKAVLAIPAKAQHVEFDPGALDALLDFTKGYPYFLQEWGYHVWNAAPQSPITLDDVALAAPDVQRQLDENFFRVRMDRPDTWREGLSSWPWQTSEPDPTDAPETSHRAERKSRERGPSPLGTHQEGRCSTAPRMATPP